MILKSIVQPFELLGVTINSSLQDVRKSYYQLALVCHPDKGGDPQDMQILHDAYVWVTHQLCLANENEKTYEQAQKEFDDFVATNFSSNIPSFTDVVLETHDIDASSLQEWFAKYSSNNDHYTWFRQILIRDLQIETFRKDEIHIEDVLHNALNKTNACFDQHMTPASVPHGYGSFIVPHEDKEIPKGKQFAKHDLIIYQEQQPFDTNQVTYINMPNSMEDYSMTCGTIHGYDYSVAFTDQLPSLEDELNKLCPHFAATMTLDDLVSQRKQFDEEHQKNVNNTPNIQMWK